MPAMRLANGKSVHCMWSMRARVAETDAHTYRFPNAVRGGEIS